uniref:Uncharacterized protein n=1 Tax=Daphnia galeata TaxID=27404 RepID=A0A8J2WLA1_9CRUS|nr:unnamed protein product [Daphnia galeata]
MSLTCRNDSDCSDKNVYCLDGYCEGCVPCQVFNREESASGCAKKPENCGPCVPGTEKEDLTGGRKSDYCKTIAGEPVNSSYATSEPFVDWSYLALSAVCVFIAITAIVAVSIRRGRLPLPTVFHRLRNVISTALTLNNPANQVVESVEYNNNPPSFNPAWNGPDMHGSTETVNNSDADSPSNRLLRPDETLNNNDVSGAYEKIETEFVTSVSSEIAPPRKADYSSIGIDSDEEIQEGNLCFSLVFRPVQGSTSGTDKIPQ